MQLAQLAVVVTILVSNAQVLLLMTVLNVELDSLAKRQMKEPFAILFATLDITLTTQIILAWHAVFLIVRNVLMHQNALRVFLRMF